MRSIKKSGIVYLPKKDEDETNVNFEKRKKFIAEMKPKNQEEYNKSLVLSRIIINILFIKCIYNEDVMKKVQKMINNM
jgi:hypothetical protein